ncbi:MAG: PaaI family thioesterase [Neomegalonema sp.]|nr:PaaI family thioesterase [Neomegalonema sp.]
MSFTPANPDFEAHVRASFAKQDFMNTCGIELIDLAPGRVALGMAFAARFTQQHGFLHAGVVTTGLDSACGYAAFTLMDAEAEVLSVEFKTNLLAPAKGERFVFRGEVLKPGRTISVSEGKAYAVTGAAEKLVASMTCTLMAVRGRADVKS